MANAHGGDRLSAQDALFVYLEKKEMPLHIGCVMIFDGRIPMQRLMAQIEARLPQIPRYRQRLVFPPFHLGHPTWEFDPEFDIRRHFRHVRLKHGTEEELRALAGEILGEVMDRNRPLWDITVIDGLGGGRSALLVRIHHCMVDGVAGVALVNVLLDASPKPPRLPRKQPFEAPPLPDAASRLLSALIGSYADMSNRLLNAQSAVLDVAKAMFVDLPAVAPDQLARLLPECFLPVERLPFNKPVLGPRQLAWAEFPLQEMKAIRVAAGCKINDIAVSIVTDAVRRYSLLHGQNLDGRWIRYMVPVNLRSDSDNPGMGNDLSLIPATVPLDIADPLELLAEVHKRLETLKRSHIADVILLGGTWAAGSPVPFQVAFGLLGNVLPVPLWHMVCTNIPGPQVPMYCLGREMLTYYPYVPIGNDMGACVAIASYNGKMFFNFSGDTAAAPDLDRLRDFLIQSYTELREKIGVAPAVHAPAKPKPEAVAAKPARKPSPRKRPAAAAPSAAPPAEPEPAPVQAPEAAEDKPDLAVAS
jgi:diacylglycerol O-acyltransferase